MEHPCSLLHLQETTTKIESLNKCLYISSSKNSYNFKRLCKRQIQTDTIEVHFIKTTASKIINTIIIYLKIIIWTRVHKVQPNELSVHSPGKTTRQIMSITCRCYVECKVETVPRCHISLYCVFCSVNTVQVSSSTFDRKYPGLTPQTAALYIFSWTK